ncbi:MAG: portal protein [Gammaproteobacteria bacterium]|nr:portal protein [Gammaproteobacteria bacterium]
MADFFGFEIKRKSEEPVRPSFVPNTDEDGTGVITSGGHFGAYLDLDGDKAKNEIDLIYKYRDIAAQPECDAAIEDIINESIVGDNDEAPVNLILDQLEISDKIKESIKNEFETVLRLLNFNAYAHDIFRKWYVDGRLPYHIIIDDKTPKGGIKELRYIDPTKLRKVKEIEETKDPKTGANIISKTDEYFLFQDSNMSATSTGLKISPDAICYATSGMLDPSRKRILSYLHKAIKSVNQLRMMEDSLVIYRISRAPERRIFYIDVGNLPKGKAEEYLKGIMSQYRNKLVYDAKTGDIKDDKKHMSMLEDFFLPRREGGRGTEITTLPGGENLGQIDDIIYFQRKLYKSLNVPINRLEQEQQFSIGRSTEISRDEIKFKKFVDRLRKRFSDLFNQLLRTQLILKGIITAQDWNEWKTYIAYDFIKDNYFSELKEAEMLRERFEMLGTVDEYAGKYVSIEWISKTILKMDDDSMKEMEDQIKAEKETMDSDGDDAVDF